MNFQFLSPQQFQIQKGNPNLNSNYLFLGYNLQNTAGLLNAYICTSSIVLHSARNIFKTSHGRPNKAKTGTPYFGLILGSFES